MPIKSLAGGARSKTAYEYVLSVVREAILDNTLPVGSKLIQSELAEALGVSTTPVREALRNLAQEGLVVFDSFRGALVRRLEIDEIREIYEMRMALEPLMVRRAMFSLSSESLDRAHRLERQMGLETDPTAWSQLNRDFHMTLFSGVADGWLKETVDKLRDSAAAYVALSLQDRPVQVSVANAEHAELVKFYRDRDLSSAVQLTLTHLKATLDTLEEAYEEWKQDEGDFK